jgi:glycosyltransferase involved in cell wall biosynthesis
MKTNNYVIITPVRDEERYLQFTIDSVVSQSIRPSHWVIVNDGSSDASGSIAQDAARRYRWIEVIHRSDRGFRQAGCGVVEAFYAGYERVGNDDYDFIVKLDGDLSFAPDYFENCLREFDEDAQLGIGGGVIYNKYNGTIKLERQPRFHVRGATKIYRRGCWEQIGGLVRSTGWDTLDEIKANMQGWSTRSFDHLGLVQQRPTGAASGNWANAVKNGLANYIAGYHPLYMLSKCVSRLPRKPYGIGAIGLLWGYCGGYLHKSGRVADAQLIRYLRAQQLRRLLLQPTIWR